MARAISQIEWEIRALNPSEKEKLLRVLLEELDGPFDAGADAAWLEESQRRSREIDPGTVQCVPSDEVFAKVDALLKRCAAEEMRPEFQPAAADELAAEARIYQDRAEGLGRDLNAEVQTCRRAIVRDTSDR